jgi:hypothetical protein
VGEPEEKISAGTSRRWLQDNKAIEKGVLKSWGPGVGPCDHGNATPNFGSVK